MKLVKRNIKKFKKLSLGNKLYVLAAGFTVILFTALAVASVFLQKELREGNFDTRKEAAIPGGAVEVSLAQPSGTEFEINQDHNLTVLINTHGVGVDGFELMFNLSTDPTDMLNLDQNDLQPTIANPDLFVQDHQLTQTNNGYQLKIIALTTNPDQPFISTNNLEVMRLSFNPGQIGQMNVSMDQTESVAIVNNSISDQLDILDSYQYQVVEAAADLNPISWITNQVRLTADDFKLTVTEGNQQQTFFADVDPLTIESDPYDPASAQDNYTTLEVGPWQEGGHQLSLLFTFYKDGDDWWLETIRFTQDDFYTDFTPSISTKLGEVFNLSGSVTYQSEDGTSQITFSNLSLEAFLDNPYCGNSVCEYGETSQNCAQDCGTEDACDLPSNLSLQHQSCYANDGQITLSWSGIQDSTAQYVVELANNLDFNNAQSYQVGGTQLIEDGLADGYWYARVRLNSAQNCMVDPGWSEVLRLEVVCDQVNQECQYIYHEDWGVCENGWQEQTYDVIGQSCPQPPWESWHRPCMNQCVYQCSDWSECGADLIQTRECTATNQPCWDYVRNNGGDSYSQQQYCGLYTELDLIFASYEACWYKESEGESTYIAWLSDVYPNVAWVDISDERNFSRFAHKNVENAVTEDGYGITTAQGFEWTDGSGTLELEPNQLYYARLYYRNDQDESYRHSRSATFKMAQCAGDPDVAYQQCNEACTDNHECAAGLMCYDGRCRLANAPDDSDCIIPDQLKGCASWCADNSECQSGLTCWYNYCRNPENIDISITDEYQISLNLQKARETNCADWDEADQEYYRYYYYTQASTSTKTGATKGGLTSTSQASSAGLSECDEYCRSNRDCEPNHRCYQNACRLAINPESEMCLAQGEVPEPTVEPTTASMESAVTPTDSAAKASPTPVEPKQTKTEEKTALQELFSYLGQRAKQHTNLLLIAGGALLVLIILIAVVSQPAVDAGAKTKKQPQQLDQSLERDIKPGEDSELSSKPN